MDDILRDLSPATLTAAVHTAMVETILDIPRVVPDWQVEQDGPFTLLYNRQRPTPLDGVFRTRPTPALADAEIRRVRARLGEQGRSVLWLSGAPDEPPDLGERLQALGFTAAEAVPGMATDLDRLAPESLPAGFSVERVADESAHAALSAIQVQTLGEAFAGRARLKRAFGMDVSGPVQHYLGRLDGIPVAAATAVYTAGVVGLYGIGTLPEARGRGLGRAITLHACLVARQRGYRVATLHATPLGLPVYRRLGFEPYGQMRFYFAPAP